MLFRITESKLQLLQVSSYKHKLEISKILTHESYFPLESQLHHVRVTSQDFTGSALGLHNPSLYLWAYFSINFLCKNKKKQTNVMQICPPLFQSRQCSLSLLIGEMKVLIKFTKLVTTSHRPRAKQQQGVRETNWPDKVTNKALITTTYLQVQLKGIHKYDE